KAAAGLAVARDLPPARLVLAAHRADGKPARSPDGNRRRGGGGTARAYAAGQARGRPGPAADRPAGTPGRPGPRDGDAGPAECEPELAAGSDEPADRRQRAAG